MYDQSRESEQATNVPKPIPDVERLKDGAGRDAAAGNRATSQLLQTGAAALPAELRARLQAQLGADLADVRIHRGPDAHRAAADLDAVAFTTGDHIVLGSAAEQPGTPAGDHLLMHELAHVVQQRRAAHVIDGISTPTDAAEGAADAVAHGASTASAGGAVHAVQRQAVLGKERMPVKREDVQQILANYLEQVLYAQGRQTLEKTPQVIEAISSLFKDDPVMQASVEAWLKGITDGTPEGLARDVARKLPAEIREDRLDKIRGKPKKPTPDQSPKTAGDAAGSVVVDSTVAPLVKKLGLSKDKEDKVISAAKSAVGDGIVGVLDAALDAAGIGGADKNAIHSAVEAAIKQQPGKGMDRKQEGAGSPDRKELPPSVAPPPPTAPGEHIFKSPTIPWDFPGTKAPPRRPAPLPKTEATVDAAASGVDPKALVPDGVAGKDADQFGAAVDFALDVAKKLDEAQAKKTGNLMVEMGAQYANVKDRAGVFARAKDIVFKMRDALSHHASQVERVTFTVNGRISYSFPLHPSAE
jgi:hypothetical protein